MSDYAVYVRKEAAKYPKVPNLEDVAMRVIDAESSGNPTARSSAGAYGLGQLMEGTAREMGVNRFDPADNVRGTVRYLAEGIMAHGLEGGLRRYHSGNPQGHDPTTDAYVRRVMANKATRSLPGVPPDVQAAGRRFTALPVPPGELTLEELNAQLAGMAPLMNRQTYDPYAPVTTPNPNYFPTPPFTNVSLMPQGFDNQATMTGPGLGTQLDTAREGQARNAVTPSEIAADKYRSLGKLLTAQAEVIKAHPAPQQQEEPPTPFPERGTLPFPDRPSPRTDPLSSILGVLGGIVDPQMAGSYGSVPFETGINNAQMEYQDRIAHYAQAAQELTTKYEDELTRRNDEIRRGNQNRGVAYQNALSDVGQGRELGNLTALASQAKEDAGVAEGFIGREQAGNISQAGIDKLTGMIEFKTKQDIFNQKADIAQMTQQVQILKTMVAARSKTQSDYYKTLERFYDTAIREAGANGRADLAETFATWRAQLQDERAKAGQAIQSAGQKETARYHKEAIRIASTPEERAAQADYAKAADMQSRRASEYSEAVRTKGRGSLEAKSAKEIAEKADKYADETRQRRDAIFKKGDKAGTPGGYKESGVSPSGAAYRIRKNTK